MGIKTYNPYTPSRRQMTGSDFSEITKMRNPSWIPRKEKQAATRRVRSL